MSRMTRKKAEMSAARIATRSPERADRMPSQVPAAGAVHQMMAAGRLTSESGVLVARNGSRASGLHARGGASQLDLRTW